MCQFLLIVMSISLQLLSNWCHRPHTFDYYWCPHNSAAIPTPTPLQRKINWHRLCSLWCPRKPLRTEPLIPLPPPYGLPMPLLWPRGSWSSHANAGTRSATGCVRHRAHAAKINRHGLCSWWRPHKPLRTESTKVDCCFFVPSLFCGLPIRCPSFQRSDMGPPHRPYVRMDIRLSPLPPSYRRPMPQLWPCANSQAWRRLAVEGDDSILLVEAPSLNRQPLPLAKKVGIPSQGDEEGIPLVWWPLMAIGRRSSLSKRVLSKSAGALLLVCFVLFLFFYRQRTDRADLRSKARPVS